MPRSLYIWSNTVSKSEAQKKHKMSEVSLTHIPQEHMKQIQKHMQCINSDAFNFTGKLYLKQNVFHFLYNFLL